MARWTFLLGVCSILVAACGSSPTGPKGRVTITGTAFMSEIPQTYNGTFNFTVTNVGSTTIEFEANMCPGTLEVLNAAGTLVYDARFWPTTCSAYSVPTSLAPGEVYHWQEAFPGKLVVSSGGQLVTAPIGAYRARAGAWFWKRFGSVTTTPVDFHVVPLQ